MKKIIDNIESAIKSGIEKAKQNEQYYFCQNCYQHFSEDDLIPLWSKNGMAEDLACPECKAYDNLIEV